jgi:hypothetical protein
MPSQAEIYRAAMRLIEQHGEAAEMAAVLRGDPLIQRDEQMRQVVIDAIAHLQSLGNGAQPN